MRSPRGGELSLSACPGVGNRPPSKKKLQIPRGVPGGGGGMVTGRIEPCITCIDGVEVFWPLRPHMDYVRKIDFVDKNIIRF